MLFENLDVLSIPRVIRWQCSGVLHFKEHYLPCIPILSRGLIFQTFVAFWGSAFHIYFSDVIHIFTQNLIQNLNTLETQEGKYDRGCFPTFTGSSSHCHQSLKSFFRAWHIEAFQNYLLNRSMNTKKKPQSTYVFNYKKFQNPYLGKG